MRARVVFVLIFVNKTDSDPKFFVVVPA